jgi:phosphoribosylamine--glycine ligase
MEAAVDGRLADLELPEPRGAAVCVVLASGGYPEGYETGLEIAGLGSAHRDTLIFHAGTRREAGRWLTSGGRVVGVTGLGASLPEARARAYAGVSRIGFPGAVFRTDIAAGAV